MHASALPEEALQHVDAVVVGEAEELWPHSGVYRGLAELYCEDGWLRLG